MDNYNVSCLLVTVIDKGHLILVISNRYKGIFFFFKLPTIDEKNFVLVTDNHYLWQKLFLVTFYYYELLLISLIKLVFINDIKQHNHKTYLLIMKMYETKNKTRKIVVQYFYSHLY